LADLQTGRDRAVRFAGGEVPSADVPPGRGHQRGPHLLFGGRAPGDELSECDGGGEEGRVAVVVASATFPASARIATSRYRARRPRAGRIGSTGAAGGVAGVSRSTNQPGSGAGGPSNRYSYRPSGVTLPGATT
jgi:hypothetical protein